MAEAHCNVGQGGENETGGVATGHHIGSGRTWQESGLCCGFYA